MLEGQTPTEEGFRVLRKQIQGNTYPSDLCISLKLLRENTYVSFMLQTYCNQED